MKKTRPRIKDIARLAGLSPATVDRVLNNRAGTSRKAVELVRNASLRLADGAANLPVLNGVFDLILPQNAGLSTEYLAAAFRMHAARRGIRLRIDLVERMSPSALAAALDRCAREDSLGVVFQALEAPLVREAASRLAARKIPLMTVVSDLAGMGLGYVGLDNRAAGPTAGYFLGTLCRGNGPVALIWGGHLYRGHDEREFGCRSVLRTEFPAMDIMDVTCTQDDADEAFARLRDVLHREPGLSGVYCVGGGIMGAVKALSLHEGRSRCRVVGHNLTANTRECLLNRSVDIIIHQDMSVIAQRAVEQLAALGRHSHFDSVEIPIQVMTRENLPSSASVEMMNDQLVDR